MRKERAVLLAASLALVSAFANGAPAQAQAEYILSHPPAIALVPAEVEASARESIRTESVTLSEVDDISEPKALAVGTHFPISLQSEVSSKTAHVGDPVEAALTDDIRIGSRLVASKGARVVGHVSTVQPARKVLRAELSRKRWLKSAGELGVQFDEIVTDKQEHLPLVAAPAKQARFVKDKEEGRFMGINSAGEITSPLSNQLKSQSIHWGVHIAASAAGIAGGPIGMGAAPVILGCVGAISPSFAFMHPVGTNVHHRRLKGFALGFVSGVPGGGLIADAIVRGPEAIIKPGDQFEAAFAEEFTGAQSGLAKAEPQPETVAVVTGKILAPDNK